ncbi:MAG: hypothetical protein KF781_01420 [Chitinophagaceae bacterium]|nr:hypothetical protein [Chitinophagaceae bacterium]MCW5905394.1 hypothetical protein [Chitinophagaceae bacterium]
MKQYFLLSILISLSTICLKAQVPDDALRTAWFTFNGSARNMAIGGVMGSLGGDISAAHVNPAGLGLFKTKEFIFSPGFHLNKNDFKFRGTDSASSKNNINYGTIGFVIGLPQNPNYSKWTSTAFSLSINQLANYNNNIQFKGFNNFSSFSEQYLEELIRDGADMTAAERNYIFGSSLAFRTYLVDTLADALGNVIGFQSLVPISTGINQEYSENTRGGLHEIALGFAGNMEDKLYVGATVDVPISSYQREFTYTEKDATNITNNDFNYFTYTEKSKSFGIGIGAKLGFIYKPQDRWRLGFAFHTPQLMVFKDQIRSWMITDTEGYAGVKQESSDNLNSGDAGTRKYYLITPWRAIVSASYVFREVSDVRKQRAFISADIEYVNYRGARFSRVNENDYTAKSYYKLVNSEVKDYYKGNFNIRLGGELKFNTFMFRLGGAFYGSPYKERALKANRILATGGIGYRNNGFFIDLAYAHSFNKDVVFPYRLNDKPNTFAEQAGSRGSIMLTFGAKF